MVAGVVHWLPASRVAVQQPLLILILSGRPKFVFFCLVLLFFLEAERSFLGSQFSRILL